MTMNGMRGWLFHDGLSPQFMEDFQDTALEFHELDVAKPLVTVDEVSGNSAVTQEMLSTLHGILSPNDLRWEP